MARPALLALAAAVALVGCDVAFDPTENSTRYFSMSGYLDTEADTQWVRVEPVDATVEPSDEPVAVAVTLVGPQGEHAFRQRVVGLGPNPSHLFWTAADVEPGKTYTVVARRPDGATTRARVRTPAPDPPPELVDGPFQCPTRLTLTSSQPVGDAFVTYRYGDRFPGMVRISRRDKVVRVEGTWVLKSYFGTDANESDLYLRDLGNSGISAEIALAIVTDDWPPETDLETALRPTDNPDIENGFGFVGGATVWRRAFQPGGSVDRGCYDPVRTPR